MERRVCPKCKRYMIKWRTGMIFNSYPPQYPWVWKCGCGHIEEGGLDRGMTDEDFFRMEWEEANKPVPINE